MSGSTPGEGRFVDQAEPEIEGSLMPGYSYTIVQAKECQGHWLLNIRNPWGNFEWTGDWGENSPLWTEEMKNELNPILEETDGTFWMSFEDFIQHFWTLNVCWVKNWEEVWIKGKFIWVQDVEDSDIEVVLSKWYYSLDINEPTRIFIGIHQEDEWIKCAMARRPYLDVGIVVLKRTNDNNVELVDLKDFAIERQVELEVNLEPGSYIILPRTTGCTLWR